MTPEADLRACLKGILVASYRRESRGHATTGCEIFLTQFFLPLLFARPFLLDTDMAMGHSRETLLFSSTWALFTICPPRCFLTPKLPPVLIYMGEINPSSALVRYRYCMIRGHIRGNRYIAPRLFPVNVCYDLSHICLCWANEAFFFFPPVRVGRREWVCVCEGYACKCGRSS